MEAFLTKASTTLSHDTRVPFGLARSTIRLEHFVFGGMECWGARPCPGAFPHVLGRGNRHRGKFHFAYGCAFNGAANFSENLRMDIKYKSCMCYMEQLLVNSLQILQRYCLASPHLKLLCYKQMHNIIIRTTISIENLVYLIPITDVGLFCLASRAVFTSCSSRPF